MKTQSSHSISARTILAILLSVLGLALLLSIPFVDSRAQSSTSGSINANGTGTNLSFTGTTISPGGNIQESTCIDSGPGQSCEVYTLQINGTVAQWSGKKVQVLLTWAQATDEYDIYIHQGNSVNGPLVTSAIEGPAQTNKAVEFRPGVALGHLRPGALVAFAGRADEIVDRGARSVVEQREQQDPVCTPRADSRHDPVCTPRADDVAVRAAFELYVQRDVAHVAGADHQTVIVNFDHPRRQVVDDDEVVRGDIPGGARRVK
jgi:hypothetical protein